MSNLVVGIRDKKRLSRRLKGRKKRRQSKTTNYDDFEEYSEEEEDEEKLILLDTLATLLSTDKLADVYFNVGIKDKKRIPAHRIILSSRSAVFERMLNGPMIESHSNFDIEVPDIEPDSFLSLLRFVYTAKSNLTPESAMGTLYAAKKYEVEGLRIACVKYLRRLLSLRNACMMYAQAQLFDEKELELECMNIIEKNANDILMSAGFRELPVNSLQSIIQSDKLRAREVVIFQACINWAESECERQNISITAENKRKVMNDVIPFIRFPLITSEEMVDYVVSSEILTSDQLVTLFSYLCANISRKPKIPYSCQPRIKFLVIGTDWACEVMQLITSYTSSVSVGSMNPNIDQPSLMLLNQYDAILVFSSSVFNEAEELGDVMADYVDNGGGVVIAAIAGDSDNHGISGRFERDEYNPLKRGERSHDSRHTLGKRIITDHPILSNVETFDGGPQSWRVKTTLAPGSKLIAEWEDGIPLIAEKLKAKSRLVALNLWPPSRHISKDGWETFTHGDRLIVNSLLYTAQLL